MRASSLAFGLTVAALSGCMHVPNVRNAPPAGPPALRAWIGFPVGSSSIYPMFLNRDAHVALFEIIPGRGVAMLYPRWKGDIFASDAHYADLTVQPAREFYQSDPFGHATFQPRYYYLVASVAPLNLTRLRYSLGATRRTLGPMYASYRPFEVIDRLTELVVPMQRDEEWTTDLFVAWPEAPPPVFASLRVITCANGRVLTVPGNYPYFGCPGDARAQIVETKRPPRGEAPQDSARPRPPRVDDGRPRPVAPHVEDRVDRRRAVAGAHRPPRDRGITSARSAGDRRDREDRRVSAGRSSGTASRPSSSTRDAAPTRAEGSSTSRGEPRSEPRTEPRSEPRAPVREAGEGRKTPR
jgi:hypothetical protein